MKGALSNRDYIVASIRRMTLFDDILMRVVFDDKLAAQHIVRVLLKNDKLVVREVRTQRRVTRLYSRDAVLDMLIEDENGRLIEVEVQQADAGDHAQRVRYYAALIDSRYQPKGQPLEGNLPPLIVIYITKTDIWRAGLTVYTEKLTFEEIDLPHRNGLQVIYVNAEVDDGSEIARLMRYFLDCNPADESQGDLSERVNYVKTTEEGSGEIMLHWQDAEDYGEKRGIIIGMERGMERGTSTVYAGLIRDGILTKKDAAKRLNITVRELNSRLKAVGV